ncbi:TerD family protein [Peribacillus sp. B-H-3]|uniref:TerD family protein n=1 Tax=Peribacillus sp. B-H-3 TaxID=3400420 RepID=UPI003B01B88F
MSVTLVKGQKVDITKNVENLNYLHVGLDWQTSNHFDIDVSAFLLGEDEKIVREEDFVFYGQTSSSNGSVRLEDSLSTIEKQRFIINLSEVVEEVHKISFTLTIYESETKGFTFADVSEIKLRIINSRLQEEVAVFPISYDFTKESAIVVGTLYRYSGEWKFHAVGAGFYGGLSDLCNEYGVEVIEAENVASQEETLGSSSPNDRFQVVHEREETGKGEVIPKQPTEHVLLKRSSVVQFDQGRIEELSKQSTNLVDLFDEQGVRTNSSAAQTEEFNPNLNLIDDADEEDMEKFIHSLTDTEVSFLKLMVNGKIQLQDANQFLRQRGVMPATFLNAINEKASKHLGDNLLQERGESIAVFEEFETVIGDIKERVGNEY